MSDDYPWITSDKFCADGIRAEHKYGLVQQHDTLKLPLGSEYGNPGTAHHIIFQHGMVNWEFGWSCKEMLSD